jgi:hypothetical protein
MRDEPTFLINYATGLLTCARCREVSHVTPATTTIVAKAHRCPLPFSSLEAVANWAGRGAGGSAHEMLTDPRWSPRP